jgi:hypothetical protein
VEVVKSFEATLIDAQKIQVNPSLPHQKDFSPKFKYDITIVPLDLSYPNTEIKPLAMNPDPDFKVNKGYINVGYGLVKNPRIMAGYHSSKKDTYDAGVHINYHSLDNSSTNPYQKYSDLELGLYGSYMISENIKLYGGLNSFSKKRYFYHTDLNVADTFSEAESKRRLNTLTIHAGITNAERTETGINYNLGMTLKNMNFTDTKARENGVKFLGHLEKHVGKSNVFLINGSFEYVALNADSSMSLSTTQLIPSFKTQFLGLIINLGVNFIQNGDIKSHLFPEISASYGIIGQNLQAFAGVGQGFYTNGLRNSAELNPYINTNLTELGNSVYQDFYGGVKGQFSFLTYQIKGGLKNIKRQAFFLNNIDDQRNFNLIYDNMKNPYISGNLNFGITENIDLGGWLTQNIFSLDSLEQAWHLPNLEANAYAKIRLLNDKLVLSSNLFFNDKVAFLNKTENLAKSNVLFDWNIKADYSITKSINIYVHGMNLLNNKYQRFYGYPSVGINSVFGVQVVF